MTLVIDASVALKWLLGDKSREPDLVIARQTLLAIVTGGHPLVQPPHWIAEVVGVMARRDPDHVAEAIEALGALDFRTVATDACYLRAAKLAHRYQQHVFDTLYHAVALEHEAVFVTADDRYFAAVRGEGRIERLQTFRLA